MAVTAQRTAWKRMLSSSWRVSGVISQPLNFDGDGGVETRLYLKIMQLYTLVVPSPSSNLGKGMINCPIALCHKARTN